MSPAAHSVIRDADRCVKCALCLPHCPTYRLSGHEAESPRGRIALMRALADQSLEATPELTRHLDQCLTCRNCEPVCPAQVPYGRLIDNGRALLTKHRPPSWMKRLGLSLVLKRRRLRLFARLLRIAQRLGLANWIPAARRLPHLSPPMAWRTEYPAAGRRRVGLFVGCIAEVLDAATRTDAIRLLNAAGYDVAVPAEQGCCGALHRHTGMVAQADELVQRNRQAFGKLDLVISTASGCGAELAEHTFDSHVHEDINHFLADCEALRHLSLHPLDARIAVYAPCTQRNVLKDSEATLRLLRTIPQADIVSLPTQGQCCGAAGSYVLEHSHIADHLGATVAQQITELKADFLAVANVGCAMHLRDHLGRLDASVEVLHPVSLLARQLR